MSNSHRGRGKENSGARRRHDLHHNTHSTTADSPCPEYARPPSHSSSHSYSPQSARQQMGSDYPPRERYDSTSASYYQEGFPNPACGTAPAYHLQNPPYDGNNARQQQNAASPPPSYFNQSYYGSQSQGADFSYQQYHQQEKNLYKSEAARHNYNQQHPHHYHNQWARHENPHSYHEQDVRQQWQQPICEPDPRHHQQKHRYEPNNRQPRYEQDNRQPRSDPRQQNQQPRYEPDNRQLRYEPDNRQPRSDRRLQYQQPYHGFLPSPDYPQSFMQGFAPENTHNQHTEQFSCDTSQNNTGSPVPRTHGFSNNQPNHTNTPNIRGSRHSNVNDKQYRKNTSKGRGRRSSNPTNKVFHKVTEDKEEATAEGHQHFPLKKHSSVSSLVSQTSVESNVSSKTRDEYQHHNLRGGRRGRQIQHRHKEQFQSMPSLAPSAHSDAVITLDSNQEDQDSTGDNKTENITDDAGKVKKKRKSNEKAANESCAVPNQGEIQQEVLFTVWPGYKDARNMLESFNNNIHLRGAFNLEFVAGSFICNEQNSVGKIVIYASSKNLIKRIVKNLYMNLKKHLERFEYEFCSEKNLSVLGAATNEQRFEGDEDNKQRFAGEEDRRVVKVRQLTLEDSHLSKNSEVNKNSRKRKLKALETLLETTSSHENVCNQQGNGVALVDQNLEPPKIPTKISAVINQIYTDKNHLLELLSLVVSSDNISFSLVPDSVVTSAAKTVCEFKAESESAAKKAVKHLKSVKFDGKFLFLSVFVASPSSKVDLSVKVEHMREQIKETINEIRSKTQKRLDMHNKKIQVYEDAMNGIQNSGQEGDSDDDSVVLLNNQTYAIIDKFKEVIKQRDVFNTQITKFVQKVESMQPMSTTPKMLSELLQAVGVECERLAAALPMYARRDDIVRKVKENQVSIILGETGSGKSTQMAQYICEAGLAGQGQIVCTQPRKVAAITLAERVAKEMAETVGRVVGYKTGLKKKVAESTRIVFSTDHCLLNECLTDRDFSRYTCIIVDEAHERNIYTDLLLGLVKACLPRRPDLRVVITSATIDPEIFIRYFNCSSALHVSGRTFPVEVESLEVENSEEFENFENKAIQKATEVHRQEEPGDILVFLTSSVEIMRCCEEFQTLMRDRNDFKCLPLHGQLPPDEQRKVFEKLPPGVRKIVFATNCAETSITIDGIKYVIDTGVAKEVRYDSKRNISMLGTYVISKSSADQRKGRAGRTASGKCYRLYSEAAYRQMETSTKPEILKVPLGQSLLKLAELGINAKRYDFVESPTPEAIDAALTTLKDLDAIGPDGVITEVGRWISKLPFNPHEGFLVYRGHQRNLLYDSLVLASLISQGTNLFYKGLTESEAQTSARTKTEFSSHLGDIFTWLKVFKSWTEIPPKQQSKWCKDKGINYKVLNFTRQCIQEATVVLIKELKVEVTPSFTSDTSTIDVLKRIIFETYMNSLCHYLGHVRAGYFAVEAERQVHFHPSSILYSDNSQPEWIVYTEFTKTSRDFVKGITVVEEDWVLEAIKLGKLKIDIAKVRQSKINLIHRELVGGTVLRKLVGPKYSQLRVWEENFVNMGMKAVVVEADGDVGTFEIYSSSPENEMVKEQIKASKIFVIDSLKSDESEFAILKRGSIESSGVRVVIGQGGCVKLLLLPNESNKVLIKNAGPNTTEEEIRSKFGAYGSIQECISFKRTNPWGFVRYSSSSEAEAAVSGTRGDTENTAVLKTEPADKKVGNKFEARLSWCRRPIKPPGTAFIKCPPIEKASLVGKYISLGHGLCEVKVPKKGDDLMCFKTGNASEIEIQEKVVAMLDFDEKLKHQVRVSVIRAQSEVSTHADINEMKKILTEEFSKYVDRTKFNLFIKPTPKAAINQVAFIKFDSPIDGFQACEMLKGTLSMKGEWVHISPNLKSTIHILKSIKKVCESRFQRIIQDLEKYKETHVKIRQLKQGDFVFDIESDSPKAMIEARDLLQRELEGTFIDCGCNDLVKILLKKQGKEMLKRIETEFEVLILSNERTEKVHVYGSEEKVSQVLIEINKYLSRLAEGKEAVVHLKGPDKPSGLMKMLMKKFSNLSEDLVNQFRLSDASFDFRQQKITLIGPVECVEKALADISEVERSCGLTVRKNSEKWLPDCVVCMCPVEDKSELYRLECCGHAYCFPCVQAMVRVALEERRFPIICVEALCGTPLVWKDFNFFLKKKWMSQGKLVEKSSSAFVASSASNYKFCLTPDCSVIYKVTNYEEGSEFTCPSCFVSVCTSCHEPYHSGLTCKMVTVDKNAAIELKKWLNQDPRNHKLCPKCKVGIEKSEGCNKMHCSSCNTYFCWICLAVAEDEQKCYAHLAKVHGGFS